jgi:hypothetical protein
LERSINTKLGPFAHAYFTADLVAIPSGGLLLGCVDEFAIEEILGFLSRLRRDS